MDLSVLDKRQDEPTCLAHGSVVYDTIRSRCCIPCLSLCADNVQGIVGDQFVIGPDRFQNNKFCSVRCAVLCIRDDHTDEIISPLQSVKRDCEEDQSDFLHDLSDVNIGRLAENWLKRIECRMEERENFLGSLNGQRKVGEAK